jgi:hypothetical protein
VPGPFFLCPAHSFPPLPHSSPPHSLGHATQLPAHQRLPCGAANPSRQAPHAARSCAHDPRCQSGLFACGSRCVTACGPALSSLPQSHATNHAQMVELERISSGCCNRALNARVNAVIAGQLNAASHGPCRVYLG